MLYRLHNNILIIGLLTLGFLIALSANRAFCAITPVTVLAFATQVLLIIWFSQEDRVSYSEKGLFLTTLIYGYLLAGLIIVVSHYLGGEEFLFEDVDGVFYYKEGLKSGDLGVFENARRIMAKYPLDDWGALLFSNFMMALVPSNYFMNAFYVLTGALSSVMLFRLGKAVMPVPYAYLAALAYSTSSYLVLFHCTYLKESFFTFLVVCALYSFYELIAYKQKRALIGVIFSLAIIVFFRPVVVAFLLMAFLAYYAVTERGSAVSLFLYGALAVGFAVSLAFMQSQLDAYTSGGNTDAVLAESGSANYSGGFNFFVGWFASLFGPFPTIFPAESVGPVPMNFYGAGLTYKLFIVIPLWAGVFWTIKRFDTLMIPVVIFVLAEIAGAAFVLASFELRKVMLHMPFIYVIAFYGLYQNEKNELNKTLASFMEFGGYAFAIGVLMLWTVIRVK